MIGRLSSIAVTLLLLSIIVFGLQQLLPGDPAVVLAGEDKSRKRLPPSGRSTAWISRSPCNI